MVAGEVAVSLVAATSSTGPLLSYILEPPMGVTIVGLIGESSRRCTIEM